MISTYICCLLFVLSVYTLCRALALQPLNLKEVSVKPLLKTLCLDPQLDCFNIFVIVTLHLQTSHFKRNDHLYDIHFWD